MQIRSRLTLRPIEEADLEAVLSVRLSNPQRLLRTEGSAGEPGHYDLQMLERDVWVADMDPARMMLVVRLRAGDRIVGLVDLLTAHPEDGRPWLGVVEIAGDHQRQGYGREALETAVATSLPGEPAPRARIDADDGVAQAFAERCGFRRVADDVWERRQ